LLCVTSVGRFTADCAALQVWKVEDGLSNKREILKLSFPEAITPYFL
jgi:hypothetical protein